MEENKKKTAKNCQNIIKFLCKMNLKYKIS